MAVSYTHLDVYKRQDAGNAATTMAPTLWEYDDFGNKVKETWKLADPATVSNSVSYTHLDVYKRQIPY